MGIEVTLVDDITDETISENSETSLIDVEDEGIGMYIIIVAVVIVLVICIVLCYCCKRCLLNKS